MAIVKRNVYHSPAYWAGFEDGVADRVMRDDFDDPREAWLYRRGFRDGARRASEMVW